MDKAEMDEGCPSLLGNILLALHLELCVLDDLCGKHCIFKSVLHGESFWQWQIDG